MRAFKITMLAIILAVFPLVFGGCSSSAPDVNVISPVNKIGNDGKEQERKNKVVIQKKGNVTHIYLQTQI